MMTGKIDGYRELSASALDAVNATKAWENKIGDFVADLRADSILEVDPKFMAVAVTHFQQGFMAITRAIAKPESRLK